MLVEIINIANGETKNLGTAKGLTFYPTEHGLWFTMETSDGYRVIVKPEPIYPPSSFAPIKLA